MNRLLKLATALLVTSLLGACTPTFKSYADPLYRKATVQQLTAINPPVPMRVEVQFMQQGNPKPKSDLRLRAHVERALAASGVAVADQQSANVLRVVVDNVGDLSEGRSAGIRNGMSLGFAGSQITDEYQVNISYVGANGKKQEVFSRHLMRTAVGSAELPTGVVALTPAAAYGQIVEDAINAALLQLQTQQILVSRP